MRFDAVRRWMGRARSATADLLFPPACIACSTQCVAHFSDLMLCDACRGRLPLIDWPVCTRCAAPVPEAAGVRLACNHCRGDRLRFERTIALGSYEGLLRDLIVRMKTDRSEVVAHTLLELAWRELADALRALPADVVTAVPSSPWRRWRRGTNPPATLAQRLAEKLGIPAATAMLQLRRNVPPQVGLSRSARFRNLSGEMAVRPTYHLQDARVLLVDDILTTGATCTEAARVLKLAGAAEVTVFVLGRTPAEQ
ncbi:MAG: amidophosphoribosyltransferase [Planctomycetota bacterium]|nr:MAG: amidophosphoribosyltransferase [Planctomycetota bacterium]